MISWRLRSMGAAIVTTVIIAAYAVLPFKYFPCGPTADCPAEYYRGWPVAFYPDNPGPLPEISFTNLAFDLAFYFVAAFVALYLSELIYKSSFKSRRP